eukprot:Plantae.Rhodophyta-Hildenbrandia_rubra.ctg9861.p2 GENE.Plantae.Rhodophyta-Hildenbrandia_rubra.ctg9861~~Plantae.Rhodophyta-Hildenbrandia_rubra.ctg9861.p2  ORF type:complete len:274 (-),score=37.11 Plantae.Rhodophyta-Hildenbrandia_rubra.ctg9861:150-971(-)
MSTNLMKASAVVLITLILAGIEAAVAPHSANSGDELKPTTRVKDLEIDQDTVDKFLDKGPPADIKYGPLTNPGMPMNMRQATNVVANITLAVFEARIGTKTLKNGCPPGWVKGRQQTHLLGARLGGSGTDPRNIVTGWPRFNLSGMKKLENAVRKWFESGAITGNDFVKYEVSAQYGNGPDKAPKSVEMKATTYIGGVAIRRFHVRITNEQEPDTTNLSPREFDPLPPAEQEKACDAAAEQAENIADGEITTKILFMCPAALLSPRLVAKSAA